MKAPLCVLVLALAALAWMRTAAAQSFPPDPAWLPFYCDEVVMSDGLEDEPAAIDERDLVGADGPGSTDQPAGLRAADDDFLYLGVRLDADPMDGDALLPFSWGMAFDVDLDATTYEVLILADGVAGEVSLFENSETTIPDDPTDPADQPPVATYAFADVGRSAATDSDFGGDDDRFLDFAVPWADLEPLGLTPDAEVRVWAASSSSASSLDGDFACHDGGSGGPALDDTASDRTVMDPDFDADGDGFSDAEEIAEGTDPDDPDDVPDTAVDEPRLEGGGGCAAANRGVGASGALALAWLVLLLGAARARASST